MFHEFAAVAADPPAEVRSASTSPPEQGPSARFNLEIPIFHTAALLFAMRAAETALWPKPFAQITPRIWGQRYREAFTRPPLFDSDARAFEWDHDRLLLNVVGHGLLGSELYFRPRRCGASPLGALAFAAGASVAWEYAFEANGVRPSALDLTYTPLAGFVLGEARYWGVRLASGVRNRPLRAVLSTLLDPFGELERGLGAAC